MVSQLSIDVTGLDEDWSSSDEDDDSDSDSDSDKSASDSSESTACHSYHPMSCSPAYTATDSDASMSVSPTPYTTTEELVFFNATKMLKQLEDRIVVSFMASCGIYVDDEIPPLDSIVSTRIGKQTVVQKVAKSLRTTVSVLIDALLCIKVTFEADQKTVVLQVSAKDRPKVCKVAIKILEMISNEDEHEKEIVSKEVEFCIGYIIDMLEQKTCSTYTGPVAL